MNSGEEIFAHDVLGDDDAPPIADDQLNSARGIFLWAGVGYIGWGLSIWYWFGG